MHNDRFVFSEELLLSPGTASYGVTDQQLHAETSAEPALSDTDQRKG